MGQSRRFVPTLKRSLVEVVYCRALESYFSGAFLKIIRWDLLTLEWVDLILTKEMQLNCLTSGS